ncbi:MAG: hypothetical protein IPJ79_05330 [Bacteroidetes bacterium]|nr:hypothetical protein [Bacteroidota bacterium]
MNRAIRLFVLFLLIQKNLFSQKASEFYLQNKSATHKECISFYQQLDAEYSHAKLFTKGKTDIGKPLNLFVISNDGDFDPESVRKKGKCVLLINNGIHPGEPDGIDASMKFAENLLGNASNKSC